MNKPNKATRSDRNRKAIAGMKKHYVNVPSIVLDGVTHTPADVERVLQDAIDAADATSAARTAFGNAVTAEKAANAKGDPLYRALRRYLINQYKTAPETLDEFGINLGNRQVPNPATVVTAIAKSKATREARHTMGPRKKAKIKGQLPQTSTPASPKPA